MKKKIVGIFLMTLLIATSILPITISDENTDVNSNFQDTNMQYQINLLPTKDAHVVSSIVPGASGWYNEANLEVGISGWFAEQPNKHEAYLDFDLSEIPSDATIVSAVLSVKTNKFMGYGFPMSRGAHFVQEIQNEWDEDNGPYCSLDGDIIDTVQMPGGVIAANQPRIEWDVTISVSRFMSGDIDDFYGWGIKQSSGSGLWTYYSKEFPQENHIVFGYTRPYLRVTYSGETPPSDEFVGITRPEKLGVYMNNNKIWTIPFSTPLPVAVCMFRGIAIQSTHSQVTDSTNNVLTIQATATHSSGINRVEFNIAGMNTPKESHTDYNAPYEWDWTGGNGPDIFELNTIAHNNNGESAVDDFLIIRIL